ncbi:hypothetical protein OESDEN_09063 [Oesophagostomum dentatum]|uniref:Uncharacterized protein n=1 Tax=Oesophagostomum dentatum TaxID=61180 RepID=A0A0B1T6S6_OESDE|nr:hypothetical protein OESDEN_09063 [Oesophagostomum dentatum]
MVQGQTQGNDCSVQRGKEEQYKLCCCDINLCNGDSFASNSQIFNLLSGESAYLDMNNGTDPDNSTTLDPDNFTTPITTTPEGSSSRLSFLGVVLLGILRIIS